MRIRTVKPEFWTDEKLVELPDSTRLFFVGLWMLSDDAGFFRSSVREIANELSSVRPVRRRERDVAGWMAKLVELGVVRLLDCGKHGLVPNLVDHQWMAGTTKRVYRIRQEHDGERSRGEPAGSPREPENARVGREGNGSEEERDLRARAREETNGRLSSEQAAELRRILRDPSSAEPAKRAATNTLLRYGYDPELPEGENGDG